MIPARFCNISGHVPAGSTGLGKKQQSCSWGGLSLAKSVGTTYTQKESALDNRAALQHCQLFSVFTCSYKNLKNACKMIVGADFYGKQQLCFLMEILSWRSPE